MKNRSAFLFGFVVTTAFLLGGRAGYANGYTDGSTRALVASMRATARMCGAPEVPASPRGRRRRS